MNDLQARLQKLGADDPELHEWVEAAHHDLMRAWDRCARGDWRIWIAGAAGVDARTLVAASHRCLSRVCETLAPDIPPQVRETLRVVGDWLEGHGPGDACQAAAERAESEGVREGYRRAASPVSSALLEASAWLARAADAAQTSEVRASVVRASHEAGRYGKWMRAPSFFDALLPAESGALEHALEDDFAYAVAAASEAVRKAARALAEVPDGKAADDALALCDRHVAERIPRGSLGPGEPPPA